MNKLNFDDYNFEVINVETTGNYLLTLNKIFAIQACKANSLKSIPFSKSESQQKGSIKMQYGALRNILRSLMKDKWKEEMRYQLEGELIPDKKAMIFELEKFNELPLKSRKGN